MNTKEILDNLISATDADLSRIIDACLSEQRKRDEEKIDNAINKFRDAFEGLQKLNIELYVDNSLVYSWDDFSFD
jgi:hypothetical protein